VCLPGPPSPAGYGPKRGRAGKKKGKQRDKVTGSHSQKCSVGKKIRAGHQNAPSKVSWGGGRQCTSAEERPKVKEGPRPWRADGTARPGETKSSGKSGGGKGSPGQTAQKRTGRKEGKDGEGIHRCRRQKRHKGRRQNGRQLRETGRKSKNPRPRSAGKQTGAVGHLSNTPTQNRDLFT